MLKKLGEVTVDRNQDYKGEIIKALETAGLTIVVGDEMYSNAEYIIVKEEENE